MRFADLVTLYFQQSSALQTLWIVYIVVIGGLLAVSALRRDPDRIGGVLATVLFLIFAHKNLGSIQDTATIRNATLQGIRQYDISQMQGADNGGFNAFKNQVLPNLFMQDVQRIGHFHRICAGITVLTLWALQLRRRLSYRQRMREAAATP